MQFIDLGIWDVEKLTGLQVDRVTFLEIFVDGNGIPILINIEQVDRLTG